MGYIENCKHSVREDFALVVFTFIERQRLGKDHIIVSTGQRIDYCFMSKSLTEFKGLDWIRKNHPLPIGSSTHVLSAQPDSIRRADRNDGTSNLQDGFGGPLSIEISEDVVGLGSYGKTLTVLYGIELPDEDEPEEDEGLLIESWTPRFRR